MRRLGPHLGHAYSLFRVRMVNQALGPERGRTFDAGGVITMGTTTSSKTLSLPKVHTRRGFATLMDGESFGTLSESFARYMGTSKFILQMSVFIAVWFG